MCYTTESLVYETREIVSGLQLRMLLVSSKISKVDGLIIYFYTKFGEVELLLFYHLRDDT